MSIRQYTASFAKISQTANQASVGSRKKPSKKAMSELKKAAKRYLDSCLDNGA